MPEQTYVPCPHCRHPYPMTAMQKELYRGRTLACNNCAKTFSADELTPVPMETPRAWSPAAAPREPDPAAGPAVPRRKSSGWVVGWLTLAGAVAVVALLLLVLVPPLNRAREQSRRVGCASNMRQLGQAMMIYASVNGGRFPDRLDRLLAYVSAAAMVCPSTPHTAASGQTPQLQAADLARGGHLSYVYVGDTYSTNAPLNPSTTIVLYEPLSNHGDGVDVLYADGHVAYLSAPTAVSVISGLPTATPSLMSSTGATSTTPPTQPAGAAADQTTP